MPVAVTKEIGGGQTSKVNPLKEYLVGGMLTPYGEGVRALNSSPDSIIHGHSYKVYEQMLNDPKIAKTINLLKISTLGDGVELLPAVPETDENYEEALLLTEFCDKALKSLEVPLRYSLEQLMDALIYGHKIAEVTYKSSTVSGFDGEFLIPDKIKVKTHGSVRFVVDNKMNVIGLFARALAPEGKTNSATPIKLPVAKGKNGEALVNGMPILPREKFMILTIRGKDSDPRGHSVLEAAFHPWHLKTTVWPEYLRYLLLCAIPLLVGYTPTDDTLIKEILRDVEGKPVRDPVTGSFMEVNPVEALRDALMNARNAEVLAVKGGSKVQEIGGQGAGTPFFKAIELFDSQMETAILLQTLATSEGIHQSRAASTMHMSVLDQLVWWFKGIVVDMLVADLLRQIVRFNFGDDALDLTPKATLGDTERRDFATDALAVAALFKAGYFQPEQLKQVDAMLGLAIRRSVDPLQMVQQLQAAGVKIAAVPPPPTSVAEVQAGPGGGANPVPVGPISTVLPTGATPDSSQTTKRTSNRSGSVKFPASGRIKSRLNKNPKNSVIPDTVNVKP